MPRIAARKCPKTGRLFDTDEAYRKHIVGLRRELNKKRPMKIAARNAALRRTELREGVYADIARIKDIQTLQDYVMGNFSEIMIAWNGGSSPAVHEMLTRLKLEEFDLRLRFSEQVGNTHNCPRSGKTNWGGRKKDLPRSYPGWSGHISYTLNFNPEREVELRKMKGGVLCLEPSRALGWIGIHTGTGGGRGGRDVHKWEYGVQLFLDDFEGLKKLYFHDKLADKLDSW